MPELDDVGNVVHYVSTCHIKVDLLFSAPYQIIL